MDAGGPEFLGPFDYGADYSQASFTESKLLVNDPIPSTVRYADEGPWIQTDTFVDLTEKFSSDKPEEFEEHLRKRKSGEKDAKNEKLKKRQKITLEQAVNEAEMVLDEMLQKHFKPTDIELGSYEDVFLEVVIGKEADEFVEKIFGGQIMHRQLKKTDKAASTSTKKSQKQRASKPQAKILPVRRSDSIGIEDEQESLDLNKPPYPLEMEFETVPNTFSGFKAFAEDNALQDPGTPVGQALNEMLNTTNSKYQWHPSYDVSGREDDPNAVKVITIGVTQEEDKELTLDEQMEQISAEKSKRKSKRKSESTDDKVKLQKLNDMADSNKNEMESNKSLMSKVGKKPADLDKSEENGIDALNKEPTHKPKTSPKPAKKPDQTTIDTEMNVYNSMPQQLEDGSTKSDYVDVSNDGSKMDSLGKGKNYMLYLRIFE
jgi:hypothetical protein